GGQEVVVKDANGTSTGGPTFTYLAPPTVETKPASSLTQTTATLNATVNPNGAEVSECKFEYGTTTAYGKSAPCSPAAGSGSSAVAVSAAVASLVANTTHPYKTIPTNPGGTSTGADAEFKTAAEVIPPAGIPPVSVETKPAGAVTQTTAQSGAPVQQAPIVKVPGSSSVKPTVKVAKVKLSHNALLVTVEVSQKGTVRITGTGLRTTIKKNFAAGSHRIRGPLTPSGVAARKHHRKLIVHGALTVAGAASL